MLRDPDEYLPEYQKYLDRISTKILQCRIKGHDFPDEDVELLKGAKSRVKVRKTRLGSVILEFQCLRKCGTTVWRFWTSDGYVEKPSKKKIEWYEYPDRGYLLPEKARSGKGVTKQMNAMARAELMARIREFIIDELADEPEGTNILDPFKK